MDPEARERRGEWPPAEATAFRRRLKVRLLRGLVESGAYRVPTEALAARLLDQLEMFRRDD